MTAVSARVSLTCRSHCAGGDETGVVRDMFRCSVANRSVVNRNRYRIAAGAHYTEIDAQRKDSFCASPQRRQA